ncbi:EAL domain-containing protein [Paenibacillus rhizoplanae]
MDDAGSGYNSLKTLVYLKPEFIKLDKSLIRGIHTSREQQELLGLVREYADRSSTRVIAEGIETAPELHFYRWRVWNMVKAMRLGDRLIGLSVAHFRPMCSSIQSREGGSMFLQIGEIAEQIPDISIHHKCGFVDQIFKKQFPAPRRSRNGKWAYRRIDYEDQLLSEK